MGRCAGPPWSAPGAWRTLLAARFRTLAAAAVSAALRSAPGRPGAGPRLPVVRGPGDPLQAASARARAGAACSGAVSSWAETSVRTASRAPRAGWRRIPGGSVRLERRLPGEVLASVVGASARGAGAARRRYYVLDDEGRLFKRAGAGGRPGFPILTGVSRTPGTNASPSSSSGCSARSTCSTPGSGVGQPHRAVSRWRAGRGRRVHAGSRHDGTAVTGSCASLERHLLKLRRLAQVRAALARRGERASGGSIWTTRAPRQAGRHPGRQEVADHGAEEGRRSSSGWTSGHEDLLHRRRVTPDGNRRDRIGTHPSRGLRRGW